MILFYIGRDLLITQPVWSATALLSIIWCIGKTYEKLTSPTHEEFMKTLEDSRLISEGKIPPPEWNPFTDFLKGLVLAPFTLALFPFVFIYEKIDELISYIDTEFLTYIKVIPEVLRDLSKQSKTKSLIPKNTTEPEEIKQIEEKKTKSA